MLSKEELAHFMRTAYEAGGPPDRLNVECFKVSAPPLNDVVHLVLVSSDLALCGERITNGMHLPRTAAVNCEGCLARLHPEGIARAKGEV